MKFDKIFHTRQNIKFLLLGSVIATIGLVSILSSCVQSLAQPASITTDDTPIGPTEDISFKIQLKKLSSNLLADTGNYQQIKSISGFTNSTDLCPSVMGCEIVLSGGQMSRKPTDIDSYAFQGKIKITTPIDEQSTRSKFYEINSDLKMFKEKVNGSKTIRFFQGFLRVEPGSMDFNITKALLFFENEGKLVLTVDAGKTASVSGESPGDEILRNADIAGDKIISGANKVLKKLKKFD
jgi:hypothetical protein